METLFSFCLCKRFVAINSRDEFVVTKGFSFLSGGLGAGPAQREVVKMKKKIPTGLQVHLEDMF